MINVHENINQWQAVVLIGNGFDLHHGLLSSYSNFRDWLKINHPTIYNEFLIIYDGLADEGEWWKDFENNLGKLNVVSYYRRYHADAPQDIIDNYKQHLRNGLPNGPIWNPAGDRLESLYSKLKVVMRQWIREISFLFPKSQRIPLPKGKTFYISFNYTSVLEHLYQIPKENILHIHGCLEDGDDLIFGHNTDVSIVERQYDDIGIWMPNDSDLQKISIAFSKAQKFPYTIISEHEDCFKSLVNIHNVYVYGLSCSEVDAPYLWKILRLAPMAHWTISYYDEKGKSDIIKSLENNTQINIENIDFIRLKDLEM